MVALQFNFCDCRKKCLEKCEKDCLERLGKLMEELGPLQEVEEINIVDEKKHPSVILSISSAGDTDTVKNLLKKYDKKFWEHRPPKKDNQQEKQIARPVIEKQAVEKKQNVKKPPADPCQHELGGKSYEQFKCAGCKEIGIVRHRCDYCDDDFHKHCASRKSTISPEFFPNYDFKFRRSTTNQRYCYACGEKIRGNFYWCESENLYLHPPCCNLKTKLYGLEFVHRHKMASSSKRCRWCKKSLDSLSGCAYFSKKGKCYIHVRCITRKVHEACPKSAINGNEGANGNGGIRKRLGEICIKLGEICKILLPFIGAVASILLGDPTGMSAPTLIAFFVNSPKLLSSKTRNKLLLRAQQRIWLQLLVELKDIDELKDM